MNTKTTKNPRGAGREPLGIDKANKAIWHRLPIHVYDEWMKINKEVRRKILNAAIYKEL